jgi:hypothetical protein
LLPTDLRRRLAVPHLVDVGVHEAGDQRLAEAEAGLDRGDLPVARDGVGREQDAGASGKTICCTTTAIWTCRWSKPFRRR